MSKYKNLNRDSKYNVLLLGVNGRLGRNLANIIKEQGKVNLFGTTRKKEHNNIYWEPNNESDLEKIILKVMPLAIINCIALTNVDRCEEEEDLAYKINSDLPKLLVKLVKKHKIDSKIIHISTDQVYDSKNWSEVGTEKPINIYSKSKLAGDKHIHNHKKGLILRTNFISNSKIDSPISWLKSKIESKKKFWLFDDIIFNPLEVKYLSKLIHSLLFRELYGIYNIGSSSSISKSNFFFKVGKILDLDMSYACTDSILNAKLAAKRPNIMTMSIKNFEKDFGRDMPSIKETIKLLFS